MNNDNVTGGPTEPSNDIHPAPPTKTDASLLEPLAEVGYELIPLKRNGKVPTDKNWTRRPYKNPDQIAHMKRGGNVGVRLRASDLVIDVDPRNFRDGDDPFKRLCDDLGFDPATWPCVETGGGGFHFYLTKPVSVPVRDTLGGYPGVEFKTLGRQVVAPGSVHPDTGRRYKWAANADDLFLGAPAAPDALIDAIARTKAAPSSNETGTHSSEEIAQMLAALDPCDFAEHETWLEVMMACHHASGGDAKAEFVGWSTGDPNYADHAELISARWDSLGAAGNEAAVTVRTLIRLLHKAGREDVIPVPSAEDDFDVVTDDDIPEGALKSAPQDMETPKILESDAPMIVAREMMQGKPLLRSNGEWFKYDRQRNHYVAVQDERFSSWCWNWVEDRPYLDHGKGETQVKRLTASRNVIANVEEAAKARRQGPDTSPGWIVPKRGDPPADEILVCANGLLHLPTRTLLPPDRRFFSVNGSPVQYDPDAAKPERWLQFLDELFPDEPDCIETLQEATGYFLTQDTSLQKIVQLVGPTRAGKGVYTRTLQSLLGDGNYTSPTVKRLSGEFGLQPLIGKQLAVISDMRLGKGVNASGLTETLLTVSGEDSVSIPRKYKDNWEGKLSTRFLIVSNELLQLKDTSNALGARMIVIVTRQSFFGREDEGLTDRLTAELPGILNWALDGLDRLKERGHLVQPKSCMAEVTQMHKLASPVKFFLETETATGSEHRVKKDRLWEAFNEWIYDEGLTYGGGKEHFIKDLNSAGGRFEQSKPRENGGRIAYLNGLDLREDFLERIYQDAKRDFAAVEE